MFELCQETRVVCHLVVQMLQSLKRVYYYKGDLTSTAPTYGLNVNSVVSFAGGPAVTVHVEALKALRLFRMRRDPVRVRVQCDELEKCIRLSWPQPLLQKPSLWCRVLFVKFNQVPPLGDQGSF